MVYLPPKAPSISPYQGNLDITSTVVIVIKTRKCEDRFRCKYKEPLKWARLCLFQTEGYLVCTRNCIHCIVNQKWSDHNIFNNHVPCTSILCEGRKSLIDTTIWRAGVSSRGFLLFDQTCWSFSLHVFMTVTGPANISFCKLYCFHKHTVYAGVFYFRLHYFKSFC